MKTGNPRGSLEQNEFSLALEALGEEQDGRWKREEGS